ncbi:hypothetical protein [Streptomyces sp. NPDC050988]|uniref:hypothetical protein n=1 Tax=Streptomyces sp. NPDC050988 TaxID=3365637 RepID=UPI0037A9EDA0
MDSGSWTYEGRGILAGWAEDHRDGAGAAHVLVALRVEVEQESATGDPLRSWRGTGTFVHEGVTPLVGRCWLNLGDDRTGEVWSSAECTDGTVTLELQGVGPAPWWPAG